MCGTRRIALAVVVAAWALAAGAALAAEPVAGITYSSPNACMGDWKDLTGRQLADGIKDRAPRGKDGKPVNNLVIYQGGTVVIDVRLPGAHRVERVVAHVTRPNFNYNLESMAVFAREQGHWVERGRAPGFWGPTEKTAFAIEVKDLDVVSDELRLQFATPALLAILEVEVFGERAAAVAAVAARPGGALPLRNDPAPSVREENADADEAKEVVLENRFVRLVLDPAGGGVCTSFLVKRAAAETAYAYSDKYGLFRDQLWDPYYFFAERVYSHRTEQHADRALVEMWTAGAGGMMGFTEVRKRVTVFRDSSLVRVDCELRNEPSSMTDYTYAWWFHNFAGVPGERITYYFPARSGVATYIHPDGLKDKQAEGWFYDPAQSWTGFVGDGGAGLAFDVENQYLNCFYYWAGTGCLTPTIEWRLNRVDVPAGGKLTTTILVHPLHDMKRLDGAFDGLSAGLETPESAEPGAPIKPRLKVHSVAAGAVDCVWRARRLPAREYAEVGRQALSFEADSTREASIEVPAGEAGTVVIAAQFLRDGKAVGQVERPVVVGGVKLAFELASEGPRLGLAGPKEQPTVAGRKLSTEFKTPHFAWARPYALGPVRALFVTGEQESRDIVELWQRMDLDFTYDKFLCSKDDTGYLYAGDRSIRNLAQAQARLDGNLKQDYDVIVVSGMKWDFHFTPEIRKKILDKVAAGAGLIAISPVGADDLLAAVPGFAKDETKPEQWGPWRSPADHPVTSALPWDVLPLTRCVQHKTPPTGQVLAEIEMGRVKRPLILASEHGKGRVLAVYWDVFSHDLNYMGFTGLLPTLSYRGAYVSGPNKAMFSDKANENPTAPYHYWEYYYALLARAVAWAGQKAPPAQVTAVLADPAEVERGRIAEAKFHALVRRAGQAKLTRLEATFLDRHWQEIARQTVDLDPAAETQTARIPPPASARSGLHFLNVVVRDDQGRSAGWGATSFRVKALARVAAVSFAKTELDPGDALKGVVKVEGEAAGKESLSLYLWDAYDRLLAVQSQPVPAGQSPEMPFEFRLPRLLVPGLKVQARLFADAKGEVIDEASGRALVKPVREYGRLLFTSWTANWKYKGHYLYPHVYRQVQRLGLDVALNGLTEESTGRVWEDLWYGFRWADLGLLNYIPDKKYRGFDDTQLSEKSADYAKTKDKKNLVRFPCLDDPDFRKAIQDNTIRHVNLARKYGFAHDYCMGDEMSLTSYTKYHDYCFDPHTLAAFRVWLRGQYRDLAALNQEWGTEFKDWDAVMPMTADEAKGRGNHAPWADFRTYMEHDLAEFYVMIQDALRTVDPEARAGLSGTQAPVAGNGMDWWRLSKAFSFYHSYNTASSEEMRRSFRQSTGVMTSPYYAGYWNSGRGLEHNVWWCLFNATTSISAWTTSLFFYGDLSFSEAGRDTRDYIAELKDGVWDLVRSSKRLDDRIAVHYSQPSVHAAYILGRQEEFDKERTAWVKLLYDLGLQFDFIAYAEIEQGLLAKRGYRVLVLPQSYAVSEAEAREIESFAQAGGLVIADSGAAVMNNRCRTLPAPRLDAMFGLRRGPAAASAKVPDGVTLKTQVGDLAAGTAIKLTGVEREAVAGSAEVLAESAGGFPVMFVNRVGKGAAAYLNVGLMQYIDDRVFHSPTEQQARQIALALLSRAGVSPRVSVAYESKQPPTCQIVRFTNGGIELVGVLREMQRSGKPETASVRFGRRAAVHDVRSRRALGVADSATVVLEPGQAKLYALFPQEAAAGGFAVRPDAAEAAPGAEVGYAVGPRPGAAAGGGVIHVEVVRPSGEVYRPYGVSHVLKPGETAARGVVPLALNDTPGAWTIRGRDVATGYTAEAVIQVKPTAR